MQQPVKLTLRESGLREVCGVTRNVSEIGLLLVTDSPIPRDARVQLTLSLQQENVPSVQLCSWGRVVRVENGAAGAIAVAVECDSPLGQA